MLKGQDVVVLLKLLGSDESIPVRNLAGELGFDVAGTHRAMCRLADAGLYWRERKHVHRANAEEFLVHAVKFSFPAQWGPEARGIPTAWTAPPLSDALAEVDELIPVWPYFEGEVRGIGFEPLHPMVPEAALSDPALAERLALVDALRSTSHPRIVNLARGFLKDRIDS